MRVVRAARNASVAAGSQYVGPAQRRGVLRDDDVFGARQVVESERVGGLGDADDVLDPGVSPPSPSTHPGIRMTTGVDSPIRTLGLYPAWHRRGSCVPMTGTTTCGRTNSR